jgi:eukaryotic-like serine/threonine-protein kinase
MNDHPTQESLMQLLRGELGASEYPAVESHLESCADCQATLDRLSEAPEEDEWRRRVPDPPDPSPEITLPPLNGPNGRYQFFGELARGGMGAVFKGRDTILNRNLAVKVLLEEHRARPHIAHRFVEEAQIGGQLQHPGIVPVYELGTLPDGRPFFTMKLVKGRTLGEMLAARTDSAADLVEFLGIFRQVCQTIAYAHAKHVIHRDLKPSNIMVGDFEEVLVMDWGLAKVLKTGEELAQEVSATGPASVVETVRSASDAHVSMDGSVLGTPAYMSPEQAQGAVDELDQRTDVFGLGAILCEILTSKPPYVDRSPLVVLKMAALAELDGASSRLYSCGADDELLALAHRCLAAEPRHRPSDAVEVARAISGYLAGLQDRARKAEMAKVEAETKVVEERKRRKLTMALAASLLLTGVLGGYGWFWIELGRSKYRGTVSAALDKTISLYDQAQRAPVEDVTLWSEVGSAIDRTESLLAGTNEPELTSRVVTLRDEIAAARKAAVGERDLLTDLEGIRGRHAEHYDIKRTDAAFTAAFRTAGLDLDQLAPNDVGAAIARMQSSVEVTSFLDYWADLRWRMRHTSDRASWQRLVDIARKADPDPWRDALRAQFGVYEHPELQRLADDVKGLEGQPVRSLILLAEELGSSGDIKGALTLLQSAWRRSPGDFWLNYSLGYFSWPDATEAIRYFTTAVAIRPRSYVAHVKLGYALQRDGKLAAAVDEFHEILRIKSDDIYALNGLGWTLQVQGKYDEATNFYNKALRIKPDSADTHNGLGVILQKKGRLDEAAKEYRKALSIDPVHPHAQGNLKSLPLDLKNDMIRYAP